MNDRKVFRVAFCGVMAGLMAAVMLLGTLIPLSTYICPMIAGALAIPVVWELGAGSGWLLYAANPVSILEVPVLERGDSRRVVQPPQLHVVNGDRQVHRHLAGHPELVRPRLQPWRFEPDVVPIELLRRTLRREDYPRGWTLRAAVL